MGRDLATLSASLVQQEVRGKIKGKGFRGKKSGAQTAQRYFLEKIIELQNETLNTLVLTNHFTLIHAWNSDFLLKLVTTEQQQSKQALLSLASELKSYLYLMITVLEFFNNNFTEIKVKQAEENGMLDILAKGRHALSIDPIISNKLINKFRVDQKLFLLLVDT